MNDTVQSLYQTIAQGCAAQRPDGDWLRCQYIFRCIERYSVEEGEFDRGPQAVPHYFGAEDEVAEAFSRLRVELAKLNNGQAWYTSVFSMTPDGRFKFDFDYDHLPAFDIMPQPDKWQDEFKKYPRPELQAQIQDWLDGSIGYDRADELVRRLADLQRGA